MHLCVIYIYIYIYIYISKEGLNKISQKAVVYRQYVKLKGG